MDALIPRQAFTDFGPNGLFPTAEPPPMGQAKASRGGRLRKHVRGLVPHRQPGVYGMVSGRGELIYVGKAKCLRTRLLSYFRSKSRDRKSGRIVKHTRILVWEAAASEFGALLRELELIQRFRPRFNVHGQPLRRRRTYVCIGRSPAPYLFLAARPSARASAYFGPVPAGESAREAVRRLNDWFGLRDCPQSQEMAFADQTELFPVLRAAGCLRYEIGTCLGPCAGGCTRSAYAERVRRARAFLSGTDVSLLDKLKAEMEAASNGLSFERAAALRDKWSALEWLRHHIDRWRQAREQEPHIYPVHGADSSDTWYLVNGGRVIAAFAAPADAAERNVRAARIAKLCRQRPKATASVAASEEVDAVLLLATWLRRHPEEKSNRIELQDLISGVRSASKGG